MRTYQTWRRDYSVSHRHPPPEHSLQWADWADLSGIAAEPSTMGTHFSFTHSQIKYPSCSLSDARTPWLYSLHRYASPFPISCASPHSLLTPDYCLNSQWHNRDWWIRIDRGPIWSRVWVPNGERTQCISARRILFQTDDPLCPSEPFASRKSILPSIIYLGYGNCPENNKHTSGWYVSNACSRFTTLSGSDSKRVWIFWNFIWNYGCNNLWRAKVE